MLQVKTIDTVVKDITPEESLVASTFVASVIQSAAVRMACCICSSIVICEILFTCISLVTDVPLFSVHLT